MKKWGLGIGLTVVICTGCFSASQTQPATTSAKQAVEKGSEPGKGSVGGTAVTAGNSGEPGNSVNSAQTSAASGAANHSAAQSVPGTGQPAQGSAGGDSDQTEPPQSPEQIEGKYVSQLSQLEGYYQGQFAALRNLAAAARQKGESKASIYSRYAGKASDLQEDSQAKVNALLFELKNELKAHHLPVDGVNALRQSYYAKIDSAKSQLLQKLK